MKKDQFLGNKQNKQRFIRMLAKEPEQKNCETYHASGNADVLIVVKAVEASSVTNTVLVGDGTDLLVLLCYHATRNIENDLFFCPEPKKNIKLKKPRCEPSVWSQNSWALLSARTYFSSMLSSAATRHLACMGSVKESLKRSSSPVTCFVSMRKYLVNMWRPQLQIYRDRVRAGRNHYLTS